MKKIKLVILIYISISTVNVFAQRIDYDYDCNIDGENYVFIDSLVPEINLVDNEKAGKYLYQKDLNFALITNKEEYNSIKQTNAKNIDFEKYNLFIGYFNRYGRCGTLTLPITVSLLFDKWSQNIVSIVQYVPVPHLKHACAPHLFTVIIPVEYCETICYTRKIIKQ